MYHVILFNKVYFKGESLSKNEVLIRYKEKLAKEREK
jgi:hypothetical protein